MATYLKKATRQPTEQESNVTTTVKQILNDIRQRRETAVSELAAKFDGWKRGFILE